MHNKTPGEVVAEARMMNAAKPGNALLIVEGSDDLKFWTPRVHAACDVINATGKSTGVIAVRTLNRRGFDAHLGVFDRDYTDALTASNWRVNEVYWDAHSLETVLFYSRAFDKLLSEHMTAEKIRAVESAIGQSLRETVESAAKIIGSVRYLHWLTGNTGDSEILSPFRHRSTSVGRIDTASVLAAGVALGIAPSTQHLLAAIGEDAQLDVRFLVRGHDVSAIVSILVASCGGHCSNKHVEEVLRVGFEQTDFQATSVYREIRAWEGARGRNVLH